MYSKLLEHIVTSNNLKMAFEELRSNASGLDNVSFKEFKTDLNQNIQNIIERIQKGLFSPEPLKQIEIDKEGSDEKRPIALSAIKDKIVQRVLYKNLNLYFDKIFSDKSYAYRPDKSTLKAINRTTAFLSEKNFHIVKTDIDSFFENIDHDKLLQILDRHIKDKKIIRLISLFVQVGGFKEMEFDPHEQGVHQGDILSPLLSNIYLHEMDSFLECTHALHLATPRISTWPPCASTFGHRAH